MLTKDQLQAIIARNLIGLSRQYPQLPRTLAEKIDEVQHMQAAASARRREAEKSPRDRSAAARKAAAVRWATSRRPVTKAEERKIVEALKVPDKIAQRKVDAGQLAKRLASASARGLPPVTEAMAAESVRCPNPKCQALVGQPCVVRAGLAGQRIVRPHPDRIALAERKAGRK